MSQHNRLVYVYNYLTLWKYYLAKSSTRTEWLYQLKGSDHRILFQNATGTINMVQLFDDPNLELEEVAWFHILGECMLHTFKNVRSSQKLIKLKTGRDPNFDENEYMSCYVELHRIGSIFLLLVGYCYYH